MRWRPAVRDRFEEVLVGGVGGSGGVDKRVKVAVGTHMADGHTPPTGRRSSS